MWTDRRSGQMHQRGHQDHRDAYERDKTRAIHCPAFRRLQRKTQILGTDEGDFHRTRLTHSLEVASIGASIARNLNASALSLAITEWLPTDDLISVIGLLHDIGHPPFGHGGEVALNYAMRAHGSFEGNGQTLRVLTQVETSYGEFGLDLTRRTLLGILKYPVARARVVAPVLPPGPDVMGVTREAIRVNDWLPPKAYYDCDQPEVEWLLSVFSSEDRQLFQSLRQSPDGRTHGKAAYHAFDCSIMDIADDIAYGVHDLEDAIHLRLIRREQLDTPVSRALFAQTALASPERLLDDLFAKALSVRKQAIGELVNYFITAVRIEVVHPAFEHPLLRYNAVLPMEARRLLDTFIQVIYEQVIDSQEARTFEYGGQSVILRLFEAINASPSSLLDKKNRQLFAESRGDDAARRVVCDYIACMTDEYAYRMHERLFGLNTRTIFERL